MNATLNSLVIKLLDDIRGSWRFRWQALAIAWGICLVGWLYVFLQPNIYRATARVFVDNQSALRPLLRGLAIEPDVESELALVRQAMLSRPNLEKVARETDLDVRATTPEEKEKLIDGLLKRITITNDARSGTGPGGLYRIAFDDFSREKSLQVVQTLLDSFVEDTLGNKRAGQEDAQAFLKDQIADYEKRLAAAETRVADFKKSHIGTMPDDRGDYFSRMQTELTGLEESRKTLALAEARHEEMRQQLSGEDMYVFGFDANAPRPPSENGGGGDISARIKDYEHREEELLMRYKDKHPEVIEVRRTLQDLRAKQAEELARLQSGKPATGSLSQSVKSNPVYQSIRLELKRTEVQIAELHKDIGQREARVADLKRLVNVVPEVEAELARLNRDYEVTRATHQDLVKRLETAQLSQSADRTGVVQFKPIDPPSAPLEPVAPKRGLLLACVLLIALAAGLASAYLLNQLRPVFQNVRSMSEILGLPVLGSVSRTWLERYRAEARMRLMAFSGALAVLIMVFGVAVVFQDAAVSIAESLMG